MYLQLLWHCDWCGQPAGRLCGSYASLGLPLHRPLPVQDVISLLFLCHICVLCCGKRTSNRSTSSNQTCHCRATHRCTCHFSLHSAVRCTCNLPSQHVAGDLSGKSCTVCKRSVAVIRQGGRLYALACPMLMYIVPYCSTPTAHTTCFQVRTDSLALTSCSSTATPQ